MRRLWMSMGKRRAGAAADSWILDCVPAGTVSQGACTHISFVWAVSLGSHAALREGGIVNWAAHDSQATTRRTLWEH